MASPKGTFVEGVHAPRAEIPFLCEAWVDAFFPEEQADPLTGALYMNRTRAPAPYIGNVWDARLDLTISGTAVRVPICRAALQRPRQYHFADVPAGQRRQDARRSPVP